MSGGLSSDCQRQQYQILLYPRPAAPRPPARHAYYCFRAISLHGDNRFSRRRQRQGLFGATFIGSIGRLLQLQSQSTYNCLCYYCYDLHRLVKTYGADKHSRPARFAILPPPQTPLPLPLPSPSSLLRQLHYLACRCACPNS